MTTINLLTKENELLKNDIDACNCKTEEIKKMKDQYEILDEREKSEKCDGK